MSKSISLYCTQPLFEAVSVDPSIKNTISSSSEAKRLISLATKHFTSELTPVEKEEIPNLLRDTRVKSMLKAAEKVGQRNGWITGGFYGSVIGAITGGIAGIAFDAFFALVLLGALLGGLAIGFVASRIQGILTRWQTEEKIASGGGVRVHT
jgi:hypothetical protein